MVIENQPTLINKVRIGTLARYQSNVGGGVLQCMATAPNLTLTALKHQWLTSDKINTFGEGWWSEIEVAVVKDKIHVATCHKCNEIMSKQGGNNCCCSSQLLAASDSFSTAWIVQGWPAYAIDSIGAFSCWWCGQDWERRSSRVWVQVWPNSG